MMTYAEQLINNMGTKYVLKITFSEKMTSKQMKKQGRK
jgi:hypothetical protein